MIKKYILNIISNCNKKETLCDYLQETAVQDNKKYKYTTRAIFDEEHESEDKDYYYKYFEYKIERRKIINIEIENIKKRECIQERLLQYIKNKEEYKEYAKLIEDNGNIIIESTIIKRSE